MLNRPAVQQRMHMRHVASVLDFAFGVGWPSEVVMRLEALMEHRAVALVVKRAVLEVGRF